MKDNRKYLGPEHQAYSEACQRDVEEMAMHPLTHQEFMAQIERNRQGSELGGETKDQINKDALAAFLEMRAAAAEAGLQDMSLDEINAEIQEVRKGR